MRARGASMAAPASPFAATWLIRESRKSATRITDIRDRKDQTIKDDAARKRCREEKYDREHTQSSKADSSKENDARKSSNEKKTSKSRSPGTPSLTPTQEKTLN